MRTKEDYEKSIEKLAQKFANMKNDNFELRDNLKTRLNSELFLYYSIFGPFPYLRAETDDNVLIATEQIFEKSFTKVCENFDPRKGKFLHLLNHDLRLSLGVHGYKVDKMINGDVSLNETIEGTKIEKIDNLNVLPDEKQKLIEMQPCILDEIERRFLEERNDVKKYLDSVITNNMFGWLKSIEDFTRNTYSFIDKILIVYIDGILSKDSKHRIPLIYSEFNAYLLEKKGIVRSEEKISTNKTRFFAKLQSSEIIKDFLIIYYKSGLVKYEICVDDSSY